MYHFSKTSKSQLATCHPDLREVFNKVIEIVDCTVVQGQRSQKEQDFYYKTGKSKVKYPNGKHNSEPSNAVDVAPFLNGSISWNFKHCLYFAGQVMGVAYMLGKNIRWGGDWDMDGEAMTDQTFQDLVHFEIVEG